MDGSSKKLLSKKSTKLLTNDLNQMKLNLRSAITTQPSSTSIRAEDILSARYSFRSNSNSHYLAELP